MNIDISPKLIDELYVKAYIDKIIDNIDDIVDYLLEYIPTIFSNDIISKYESKCNLVLADKIEELRNCTTTKELTTKYSDLIIIISILQGYQKKYDEFWDRYQENGNRNNYAYAFSYYGWTIDTFKPKYDIEITGNTTEDSVFYYSKINDDLDEIAKRQGINISINITGRASSLFRGSYFTHIGTIDINSTKGSGDALFYKCQYLTTIRNITIHKETDSYINWSNMFMYSRALKSITISGDGKIKSNLSFSNHTLLTSKTIENIFEYLDDEVSDKKLQLASECKTTYYNAHSDEYSDVNTAWESLISTKPNWTVSLI